MWFSKVLVFAVFVAAAYAQGEPGVLETAVKFVGQCGDKDLSVCVKERALRAIETASGDVEITEGITLKKDETAVETTPVEESALPEEGRARESAIDNLLFDSAMNFLTSHTLEFKIPKSATDEVKRSLEEARKKKKKGKKLLLPLLLLLKLKAALILPVIFGAIAFIAIKALLVGKIALILSLVSALKKLWAGKHSHDHDSYDVIAHQAPIHHAPAWPVADEHYHHDSHHGGHFRRSLDAQNLAYNAYSNNQ